MGDLFCFGPDFGAALLGSLLLAFSFLFIILPAIIQIYRNKNKAVNKERLILGGNLIAPMVLLFLLTRLTKLFTFGILDKIDCRTSVGIYAVFAIGYYILGFISYKKYIPKKIKLTSSYIIAICTAIFAIYMINLFI